MSASTTDPACQEASAGRDQETDSSATDLRELTALVSRLLDRMTALEQTVEQSVPELGRLEQELKLVARERDELRSELTRVEDLQTDTLAYDSAAETTEERRPVVSAAAADSGLPSIDELMALNTGAAPLQSPLVSAPLPVAESPGSSGLHELISADEIVAPRQGEESAGRRIAEAGRWKLVRLDAEPALEYPLDEPLLTIGRSASADIQVDTDFISRIHARLLRIDATFMLEDAGSRNGVQINGEQVARWPLKHGDQIQIGSVTFRFVDQDSSD